MTAPERLRLYGRESDAQELDWEWVEAQLGAAGTYWVVPRPDARPHPRPVWGVWREGLLNLSIGTPANTRALAADPVVTVHLDSGTDVVIVEGQVSGATEDAAVVADYDARAPTQRPRARSNSALFMRERPDRFLRLASS